VIHLTPKSEADLESFFSTMWASYLDDVLAAGFTPEEASANVERNRAALFVDGVPNDNQHFFNVMDDETPVGSLWLAERPEGAGGEWFVYDIVIDEALRGRGLGRQTMQAAEEYVRAQGAKRLGLNVFGPNVVARTLYESLGFKALAINMRKDLS
jgi:GNAT superfamily N-acetyltransferase